MHYGNISEKKLTQKPIDYRITMVEKPFYGRVDEIKYLKKWYDENKIICVEGIAGMGKTILVTKFISEHIQNKVFWYKVMPWSTKYDIINKLSNFSDHENLLHIYDNIENANEEVCTNLKTLLEQKTKIILIGRRIPQIFPTEVIKNVKYLKLKGLDKANSKKILNQRNIYKNTDKYYQLVGGHPFCLELIDEHCLREKNIVNYIQNEILGKIEDSQCHILRTISVVRYPVKEQLFFINNENLDFTAIDMLLDKSLLYIVGEDFYDTHELLRSFFNSRLSPHFTKIYHSIAAKYYEVTPGPNSYVERAYHLAMSNDIQTLKLHLQKAQNFQTQIIELSNMFQKNPEIYRIFTYSLGQQ